MVLFIFYGVSNEKFPVTKDAVLTEAISTLFVQQVVTVAEF
jgi:hypothetical protein